MMEVRSKLEEDANQVLKFMASNGLVANSSKTTLMFINGKKEKDIEIQVGDSMVKQESTAKLLGIMIDDNMKWDSQIN